MHQNTPTNGLSRRTLFGGALAAAGATAVAGTLLPATAGAAAVAPRGVAPDPPAEMYFHVLPSPVRAYDSRSGYAPDGLDPVTHAGDSMLLGGNLRVIDVGYILGAAASPTGVPGDARAVLCNLAVTGTVGSGWLRVWGRDAAEPTTANINWTASGATTSNMCVSACTDAYINVRCGPSASPGTHFIIDVFGYYTAVYTGP